MVALAKEVFALCFGPTLGRRLMKSSPMTTGGRLLGVETSSQAVWDRYTEAVTAVAIELVGPDAAGALISDAAQSEAFDSFDPLAGLLEPLLRDRSESDLTRACAALVRAGISPERAASVVWPTETSDVRVSDTEGRFSKRTGPLHWWRTRRLKTKCLSVFVSAAVLSSAGFLCANSVASKRTDNFRADESEVAALRSVSLDWTVESEQSRVPLWVDDPGDVIQRATSPGGKRVEISVRGPVVSVEIVDRPGSQRVGTRSVFVNEQREQRGRTWANWTEQNQNVTAEGVGFEAGEWLQFVGSLKASPGSLATGFVLAPEWSVIYTAPVPIRRSQQATSTIRLRSDLDPKLVVVATATPQSAYGGELGAVGTPFLPPYGLGESRTSYRLLDGTPVSERRAGAGLTMVWWQPEAKMVVRVVRQRGPGQGAPTPVEIALVRDLTEKLTFAVAVE
jgi:hypothetical protein